MNQACDGHMGSGETTLTFLSPPEQALQELLCEHSKPSLLNSYASLFLD